MTDSPPTGSIVAQPTPGPWSYYHDDTSGAYAVMHESATSEPGELARVYYADEEDRQGEALANVHLIAAAPLMLDALRAIDRARSHDQDEAYDGCDGDCDAAIALWAHADRLVSAALAAAEAAS